MTNVKDLYAQNKPTSSNGLFLKFEDGQTVQLRVLDIPVVFQSEYEGKFSTKWAWPVYNHDEQKVQILQGGSTIYNAINDLIQDDDYGDPSEYDIKITRTGKGTDTKYSILPPRNSKDVPSDLETVDVETVISASPFASQVHKLGDEPQAEIEDRPIDLDEIPFP